MRPFRTLLLLQSNRPFFQHITFSKHPIHGHFGHELLKIIRTSLIVLLAKGLVISYYRLTPMTSSCYKVWRRRSLGSQMQRQVVLFMPYKAIYAARFVRQLRIKSSMGSNLNCFSASLVGQPCIQWHGSPVRYISAGARRQTNPLAIRWLPCCSQLMRLQTFLRKTHSMWWMQSLLLKRQMQHITFSTFRPRNLPSLDLSTTSNRGYQVRGHKTLSKQSDTEVVAAR